MRGNTALVKDLFNKTINCETVPATREGHDTAIGKWHDEKLREYDEVIAPRLEIQKHLKEAHAYYTPSRTKWKCPKAKARFQTLQAELTTLRAEKNLVAETTLFQIPTYVKKLCAILEIQLPEGRFSCQRFIEKGKQRQKKVREEMFGEKYEKDFLKWDVEPMVATATEILGKESWGKPDKNAIAWSVALCSGRRCEEIGNSKYVWEVVDDFKVRISGLAKNKNKSNESFEFPTLCRAEDVVTGVDFVREHWQSVDDLAHAVTAHCRSKFPDLNSAMRDRFQRNYSVHINRHLYVACQLAREGAARCVERVQQLLGHASLLESAKYFDIRCPANFKADDRRPLKKRKM
jgi:hypothetical protein